LTSGLSCKELLLVNGGQLAQEVEDGTYYACDLTNFRAGLDIEPTEQKAFKGGKKIVEGDKCLHLVWLL
jgi:hypothetical protein